MEIINYEAIINKKNSTCAIVINSAQYNIKFFKNEDLKFKIMENEQQIKVFSNKKAIFIKNIDNELKYFAYKTDTLVIMTGTKLHGTSNFDGLYEAVHE